VERGENVVVGVNKFTIENEKRPDLLRVDEALGERRRREVALYREQRDNGAVRTALEALTRGADGSANLMPLIIAAVKAEATVGEVADAMRTVFGEYQERLVL
jgi:methylmalonyl-CoA mutase N-terminal domain/subunit